MTKLSIVIPVYNKANFLRKTLNSIFSQTYKSFEVILVDDKSTDNSLEICHLYKHKYQNIIVIEKNSNTGVSDSRNIGILSSSGTHLLFLDADDTLISSKLLTKVMEFLESNINIDYLVLIKKYYGKILKPNKFSSKFVSPFLTHKNFYQITNKSTFILKNNFPFGGSACCIISKKLSKDYFFLKGLSEFEDWNFFLRIFLNSTSCLYKVEAINIHYDIHSLSRSKRKISLSVHPLYVFLNTENHRKLRTRFFWIRLASQFIYVSNLQEFISLIKSNFPLFLQNFEISKYSIFCFINILSFNFFQRLRKT